MCNVKRLCAVVACIALCAGCRSTAGPEAYRTPPERTIDVQVDVPPADVRGTKVSVKLTSRF